MENKKRIYGLDPGSIENLEQINNLSELDLYFAIDGLGYHIWYCIHAMSHDRIPKVDLTEEQYALEYLVYQTRKFGVELPDAVEGKHIERTQSYDAWYRFYHNHFNNVLTKQQFEELQYKKINGENIDEFMPQGSWKDLLIEQNSKILNKTNQK